MTKCKFCNQEITGERADYSHTKYCSKICNKRAYYVRNLKKNQISIFTNKKEWDKTETGKGYLWEQFIANLIKGEWQGFGNSFDILANGKKIDVKSCNVYKRKYKRNKLIQNRDAQTGIWVFNKNATQDCVDFFICIGLVDNKPSKIYKIPQDKFNDGISISTAKSKYDNFLVTL